MVSNKGWVSILRHTSNHNHNATYWKNGDWELKPLEKTKADSTALGVIKHSLSYQPTLIWFGANSDYFFALWQYQLEF